MRFALFSGAAIIAFTFFFASRAGAAPVAQYNPSTGGVEFVGLVQMRTITLTAIDANNTQLLVDNAVGFQSVALQNNRQIRWSNPTGGFLDPGFFGGYVVPVGFPREQLYSVYTSPNVRGDAFLPIVVVPEPGIVAMAVSGLVPMLLIPRRRRTGA